MKKVFENILVDIIIIIIIIKGIDRSIGSVKLYCNSLKFISTCWKIKAYFKWISINFNRTEPMLLSILSICKSIDRSIGICISLRIGKSIS